MNEKYFTGNTEYAKKSHGKLNKKQISPLLPIIVHVV